MDVFIIMVDSAHRLMAVFMMMASAHRYITDMAETEKPDWLGDHYEGEYKQGWYHGFGRLQTQDGVIYEGYFAKGHFHGEGKLQYPNGGEYKAIWEEGKMISGQYYFKDRLQYEQPEVWKHCINDDRRFYEQYLNGIKPAGSTQQTKEERPYNIPSGTYDTGDGYYEPVKSIIFTYDGEIHRTPSEEQVKFIMEKCRYVPKLVNISGEKDSIIKKVLAANHNQEQAQ